MKIEIYQILQMPIFIANAEMSTMRHHTTAK